MKGHHTVQLLELSDEFKQTPFAKLTSKMMPAVILTRSQKQKMVASISQSRAQSPCKTVGSKRLYSENEFESKLTDLLQTVTE